MRYLIELHETFAQAGHFIAIDYCGVSVPGWGCSIEPYPSLATNAHTVGRRDDVIEQLSSTNRTSAALHMVHGSRVGLSGLVHFGGRGECEMAR